ncbi:MAG: hypothetical protein JW955_20975 [Sedimentisphaerales bacterium]|nr:hypothetical protein [Sedimentisphaerales bacterium]
MRAALVTLIVCLLALPANAQYSGGTGEPNDPYQIATASDLIALGSEPNDYDRHFLLTADIDLAGHVFGRAVIAPAQVGGRGGLSGAPFTGVFDGNGHTTSHLTITGESFVGLFGRLGSGSEVIDLGVVDVSITGAGSYVGTLAGENLGIITDSYATGDVAGDWGVGGLVGINGEYSEWYGISNPGTLSNCWSAGAVSGSSSVGGLVGNNDGRVAQCYSTGVVTSLGDSAYAVGGLVGGNQYGTVASCYSTCEVSGETRVGGLVGDNSYGHVLQSYSTGAVGGSGWDVGGLVGGDVECDWQECYSTGVVIQCFWDVQTSGQMTSAGGEGRTTAEMQTAATFTEAGWDFVGPADGPADIWAEPEGRGYPIQWWQLAVLPSLPDFSGGTGQVDDPYLISTAEELNSISYNPRLMESYFKLTADVSLAGLDFYPIGNEASAYAGVFDGNNHMISNFAYDSNGIDDVGLFGYVRGGAIKDLGLIDPKIDAGTGNCVGSLVGYVAQGTIANCYASGGAVSASGAVGGLVGSIGLSSTVTQCCSNSVVTGTGGAVGGLVGANVGSLTQCYSTGAVEGYWYVGGLLGYNYEGSVTQCYSTGAVKGWKEVGGLVGYGASGWWWGGNVAASFWDIQASGQTASGGGEGKTTAEMLTAKTFLDAGWDFVDETENGTEDIWWIYEDVDYPRLWFETVPALRAFDPDPPNGSTGVSRSPTLSWASAGPGMEHDVYLGDNEAAVANATPASSGIYLGRQPSETTTFRPANLEWLKTYYWRIDEVNQADPSGPTMGRIWSFTVSDFIVSRSPGNGAGNVSQSPVLTWVPGGPGLKYDVYLDEAEESVANATTESQGVYRGRQTSEMTNYAPSGLKWGKTYYWRIDVVDEADPAGAWKSDVWRFTTADFATSPYPADGDISEAIQSLVLSWLTAAPHVQQDIYFGEDETAVTNATPESEGIYRGRRSAEETSYAPGPLELGKTYYWRIDAVDPADPSRPSKGKVWSFKAAHLVVVAIVDDFESYTDEEQEGNRIFETWIDGYGTADNGAIVGYLEPPYAEQIIVHGGRQSMPLFYGNGPAFNSEAQRTWATPEDWTIDDIQYLTLYFQGRADNALDCLYVGIQDASGHMVIVMHPNANALGSLQWQQWRVPLRDVQAAGVNTAQVKTMMIGVGNRANPHPGGAGVFFIDDICLMKTMP